MMHAAPIVTKDDFRATTLRFVELLHRRTLHRITRDDPLLSQLALPPHFKICPNPPPIRAGDEKIIDAAFAYLAGHCNQSAPLLFIEVGAGMSLDSEPGAYRSPWLARALRASQRKLFPRTPLRIIATDQDELAQHRKWESQLFSIE